MIEFEYFLYYCKRREKRKPPTKSANKALAEDEGKRASPISHGPAPRPYPGGLALPFPRLGPPLCSRPRYALKNEIINPQSHIAKCARASRLRLTRVPVARWTELFKFAFSNETSDLLTTVNGARVQGSSLQITAHDPDGSGFFTAAAWYPLPPLLLLFLSSRRGVP